MRRAMRDVHEMLDRHATRKSVEDLARAGKTSVRTISEEKVLRLIEALIDDAIAEQTDNVLRRPGK